MLCAVCGGENGQDHAFCIHCGTSLQPVVSAPEFPRRPVAAHDAPGSPARESPGADKTGLDGRQKIRVISAAAIAASFLLVFVLTGGNPKTLPALLLLFLPIIAGEIIFLRDAGKAVAKIEKFEVMVREKAEIGALRGGRLRGLVSGFLFSCAAKTLQKADRIEDRHLRAGAIASVALYAAGFLAYMAAAVMAAVFLH